MFSLIAVEAGLSNEIQMGSELARALRLALAKSSPTAGTFAAEESLGVMWSLPSALSFRAGNEDRSAGTSPSALTKMPARRSSATSLANPSIGKETLL